MNHASSTIILGAAYGDAAAAARAKGHVHDLAGVGGWGADAAACLEYRVKLSFRVVVPWATALEAAGAAPAACLRLRSL